jgi:SRSO17 transposase
MSASRGAPGRQQERLAAYLDRLAQAAGHADRAEPCKAYCAGLLLPGERKSVEPMAARVYPHDVQRKHQSLHHFVADAGWEDERMLAAALGTVVPALLRRGPIIAWIVDETGMVKKGRHSVGVARQYCGEVGKQENCRVAVSLSLATEQASMPVAFRLYLPREWADDSERRRKAGVPESVRFQTKPEIALDQIRAARAAGLPEGVVLGDAAYGTDTSFRRQIEGMGMQYVLGVLSSLTVWPPGQKPPSPARWKGTGRPPTRPRRSPTRRPLSLKELAQALMPEDWTDVAWRQGTRHRLRSRFAALRIRPAQRDSRDKNPFAEQWLLVEWPRSEPEPTKYWLSNLPADTGLKQLVHRAKHRWIIERDYEELKQELGLGHYEGRNWRGFHHHTTLCIAAYGFLVAERSRFSPSAAKPSLPLRTPRVPANFRPRGAPPPPGTA